MVFRGISLVLCEIFSIAPVVTDRTVHEDLMYGFHSQ
jgi:hypothetical protein